MKGVLPPPQCTGPPHLFLKGLCLSVDASPPFTHSPASPSHVHTGLILSHQPPLSPSSPCQPSFLKGLSLPLTPSRYALPTFSSPCYLSPALNLPCDPALLFPGPSSDSPAPFSCPLCRSRLALRSWPRPHLWMFFLQFPAFTNPLTKDSHICLQLWPLS